MTTFDEYLARIKAFTDDELIAREPELVERGEVPPDLMRRITELGLFGITLPREWGGFGWTMAQQVLLTMEFTRASCVYRSRFSTTIGLASQIIHDHGTDEQRASLLPRMATGQCVTAFALTEPETGSDAGSVRTSATRDGTDYVLNGHKRFITNAGWADLLLVFARTDPESPGGRGISALLVDPATPGVEVRTATRMNGHAENAVGEVAFTDARVPTANVVGGNPGNGLKSALRGINHARTHVAATAVGQARRLLDEAASHAAGREQFGHALAQLGTVEAKLGSSFAELEAGRAFVLDVAREFDDRPIPRHRIAAAKYYCTEMASRVADRAVQILGGEGIVGDSPVPRMWRDVRALRIYEGASEVHEGNLGRHVTSLASDRA